MFTLRTIDGPRKGGTAARDLAENLPLRCVMVMLLDHTQPVGRRGDRLDRDQLEDEQDHR
jgi:hypothetical protein